MSVARVNSALIRKINTARLFHALRENPDISQRRLAALTGIDAATVSIIATQLEAGGIVQRGSVRRSGRAGRPEAALRLAPDGGWLIGAGIEPDVIRLVATGLDGQVRARLNVAGTQSVDAALAALRAGVDRLLADCGVDYESLSGIGVGVPGLIDTAGQVLLAPNLGWRNVPVAGMLSDRFPVPVHVDNDTKAAALAEHLFGDCRGVQDFIFIHGHSGIGGGVYLMGNLYRGAGGLAGEIGHMKIVPGGRPCGCGGRGCFEAYVSEPAIRLRLAEKGRTLADAEVIARAAAMGDPVVLTVLAEAGEHLGFALGNLINIFNPGRIVLGGNLAALAEHMLPAAHAVMAVNALAVMQAGAGILVSPLGNDSVPMGGVALAMDGFLGHPRILAQVTQPRQPGQPEKALAETLSG